MSRLTPGDETPSRSAAPAMVPVIMTARTISIWRSVRPGMGRVSLRAARLSNAARQWSQAMARLSVPKDSTTAASSEVAATSSSPTRALRSGKMLSIDTAA